MRLALRLATVLACSSIFVASCSDDDDPMHPDGGTGGHTGGKVGTGGKIGTGGKVGTGGNGTGGSATGGADASSGGNGTGGMDAGDAGPVEYAVCAGKTGDALVECGDYLVDHLAACVDCHTPRNPDGSLDTTKALAGNPLFADLDPQDDQRGAVPAPNLTTLQTRGWTADDVKRAVLNGERSEARGGGMLPIMPYYTLHNLAPIDADAMAAYLLALDPITNAIPQRQPLPAALESMTFPTPPFDAALVPDSTLDPAHPDRAQADYGKYLASAASACLECHTPRTALGVLDPTKLFAGGESFMLPFGTVVSTNVTPASNGISGWTAEDVQKLLLEGVDRDGNPVCPPMPVGPNGAFGGITPEDALAIGRYITTLPPIVHPETGSHPACELPPPPDAG